MSPFQTNAAPLPILVSGNPLLRQRSTEATSVDAVILAQASGLIATLRDFRDRSGFGRAISAPQIGWLQRVVAMNLGAGPFVLVNPEITWRSDDTFMVWDDCLSVPDVLVHVRRHRSVSLSYRDHRFRPRQWNRLPLDLSELIQHEIDHLNGVLMTDLAEGDNAIQPLSRWAELVGAARPTSRLSLDHIAEAAAAIDPVFTNSPQYECESLSRELGVRLTLKVETANPIRSFKGRGASYFIRKCLDEGAAPRSGFACASAGNFAQALAYAGRIHRLPLTVFAAENANVLKVERMRSMGAQVRLGGADFDAAKSIGREWARAEGIRFVEDGRESWITEGAGTIGREILSRDPALDVILVPLGNGALLNGIARWVKAAAPAIEVIGVSASGAPAMALSWRNGPGGAAVETPLADTIADGVAVRVPVPEALSDMHGLVDDVILVEDEVTRQAMGLVLSHTGVVVEPAGALGVAAIMGNKVRFADRQIATILSGGNSE
ncbi:MAG: pyridoxal-phosphate dependent enzyme [Vicinamibacteria bacterium]|nr:pyridoxal-phosphate dependent enzyme [Vicinamibacteria bacterium]